MMSDAFDLAEALDVAQLVPAQHAAYRPLVADGLLFFLEHLPPQRLAGILTEQVAMPRGARLAERAVAVMRRCPSLHKLGQVVARDRRLAADLRRRLQRLESLAPATPTPDVLAVIRREVGATPGLAVATHALAEASVAVVLPFTWREPGTSTAQEGVFKVLKPGVEERLQEELDIWAALGAFLEERCAHYGLPVLDYRDTLERVHRLLLNEIRLDLERAHLTEAAHSYADFPEVLIPRLLPFSTSRVTAMERVYGGKVTDADAPADRRRWLAETIVQALVARPFWSGAQIATFHADPHAGNLFFTRDGRLAILDWSLTAQLTKVQREEVVQLILGGFTLDDARICRALAALARRPPDTAALGAAVADALRQVRRGIFPGFDWLLGLLDRLATSGAVTFPEDLVMFRKALLSLSGVVADVSAGCSSDRVLMGVGAGQFLRDLPGRAWAPPDSRAFGTHVSAVDLLLLWACFPATAARFWIEAWRDTVVGLPSAAAGTR